MAKTKIINPNADILSDGEKEFITENRTQTVGANQETTLENANKTRTRSISMTDALYIEMENFLKAYPEERSKSSIIHRAVKVYMAKKKAENPL